MEFTTHTMTKIDSLWTRRGNRNFSRFEDSRLRKKTPLPAPLLLSPPGQGEKKIEEGRHSFGCAQDKLLRRVLMGSGITARPGTPFSVPC